MNRIQWLGQYGTTVIDDTAAHTGKWFAIQIVEEAAFSVLTDASMDGDATAMTFAAGILIFGSFTAITLASGSAIAYKLPT